MTKIVSFHSFRHGSGRTSLLASLAVLLAKQGKCVGVIDANMQSPSAHILFNLHGKDIDQTLDNFLWGECTLEQAIYNIGKNIGIDGDCLHLIPSSDNMARIMHILREGIDINALMEAFSSFAKLRNLEYLFIDSSSGISEDILLSLSIVDVLVIVMRLDEQDYQGVGITLEIARRLDLARSMVVVNHVPPKYELSHVEMQVQESFKCEVGAVLPHSDEFLNLASKEIFVQRYPDHPLSLKLEKLAARI